LHINTYFPFIALPISVLLYFCFFSVHHISVLSSLTYQYRMDFS